MAPAAECKGCGAQWKTGHEPAAPGEMDKLLNAVAAHKARTAFNTAANIASATFIAMGGPRMQETPVHKVRFTYHETTPPAGFEDAEIV